MIKQRLSEDLKKAVESLGHKSTDIVCDIPQNPNFGDCTSNIALQLSKQTTEKDTRSPRDTAKQILEKLGDPDYLEKAEIAGPGFINFFIKPEYISQQVGEILELGEKFGENESGKGQKVQVEFISANPTGPLTLANGRGGTVGDTLANVLQKSGFEVEREYYVNDTGNQVRLLEESVLAAAGKVPAREEHYQGEYIKELAIRFKDQLETVPQKLGHLLADYLLENEIKPAIDRLGVKFDEFYSERSLHERNLVSKTAEKLKKIGAAYEKDGALWLRSSGHGDEKDRVLVTSKEARGREEPTYLLADIAYHLTVFEAGFVKKINLWGADHHGYEKRVEAALETLGYGGRLDVIFMQMVKLFKEGKEVRMSKRAGTFATLDELLEAVGKDAARFFFLMYSPDSHISFNLDLAKERSNKNPVYYVQYAHARLSNITKRAQTITDASQNDYGLLASAEELNLIRHIAELPALVLELSRNYQVHHLTIYSIRMADLFHRFYEKHRVLGAENKNLEKARLGLVKATRIVLSNTLKIMGVAAPERM